MRVLRRALLALAFGAALWSGVVWLAGPFRAIVFGLRVSAIDPLRPLLVALVAFGAYAASLPRIAVHQIRTLVRSPVDHPARVAKAMALAVFFMGVWWGSTVAGGSDSYGYVSQAALWRHATLIVHEEIANEAPWPNATWTFAPLGYRPSASAFNAVVPSYAPGLPLLMALGQTLVGFCGAFVLTPLAGAAVVWLTYALGRRLFDSPVTPLAGAVLVATSPAFLFQLMWPLSDIPATAAWTTALLLVATGRPGWAGLAMAATLAIRPNLLPLPLSLLAWALVRDIGVREGRGRLGYTVPLAAGVVPVMAGVAWLNAHLYGSPLASGYGSPAGLFALGYASINAGNFSSWILQTETPAIALAALFFVAPRLVASTTVAFPRLLVGGTVAAVTLAYLFYLPPDAWWYLRFLLPMWPVLMLLTAGGIAAVAGLAGRARSLVLAGCVLALAGNGINEAIDRHVFLVGRSERRYVDVARFVEAHTDPRAVVISMQHSGSIRLYAGRLTLRYDVLDDRWLDKAVAYLQSIGRHPYIVLDDWETARFRRRFASSNRLGAIDWPPVAALRGYAVVNLYDPLDTSRGGSPSLMPTDAMNQRTGWPCERPREVPPDFASR